MQPPAALYYESDPTLRAEMNEKLINDVKMNSLRLLLLLRFVDQKGCCHQSDINSSYKLEETGLKKSTAYKRG